MARRRWLVTVAGKLQTVKPLTLPEADEANGLPDILERLGIPGRLKSLEDIATHLEREAANAPPATPYLCHGWAVLLRGLAADLRVLAEEP
jgi:hypothetical protein